MNIESGIQIDIFGAIKRRALMTCAIAGVVTLAMYWIAMALPNEYASSAVLLVEPQTVNKKLVEAGAASVDLGERLNLMTSEILSRARLSRIIDDLGLYPEESKNMTRQQIVDLMRRKISVRPVIPELTRNLKRNDDIQINTFEIFYSSAQPKTAADVANHLANDFIQEHIAARVKTTQTSVDFIGAEVDRLSAAIRAVEKEVADVKEANERSLPENLATTQRLLERTYSELRTAQRGLDMARSDASFWEHQSLMAAQQAQMNPDADVGNPGKRLQGLELALAEMSSRGYTERHPDVIATKQEIEELRASIQRSADEFAETGVQGEILSFSQQNAESEKRRAQVRITAAEEETVRLEGQIEGLQANVVGTPRVAEQLEALSRHYRQLSDSQTGFATLRTSAAVQADLERRQLGERFRLLESAIPPQDVASPNRKLILALGLMLGLAAGVGAGVIAEGTDPSYHQQRDLQASVGIPVLAVIPSILFDADLEAMRRIRRIRMLAAAAVMGFCLVGGVLTYIAVNGAPPWLESIISGGEEAAEAGNREALRSLAPEPLG